MVDGLPFVFSPGLVDVSTSMKGAKEPCRVSKSYLDPGDPGSQPDRLIAEVPAEQYAALHVLAFSRKLEGAVPRMTVRIGLMGGGRGLLENVRFNVPNLTDGGASEAQVVSRIPVKLADKSEGWLYHMRIPLPQTGNLRELADGDKARPFTLEFTRDVNVHTTVPEPYELAEVPAGQPSAAVIAAATMELSPVTVVTGTEESGNIFYETQKAAFQAKLHNRATRELSGRIALRCAGPGTAEEMSPQRGEWTVTADYRLAPGEKKVLTLDATPPSRLRGWYSCEIETDANGVLVQKRSTSFAILAPDTRKAKADSPFGVWCFFK